MGLYAQSTEVPADRTMQHIKQELARYGADSFMYAEEPGRAMIQFRYQGRSVRFTIEFSDVEEFRQSPAGRRERTDDSAIRLWDQSCRQKWRALYLFVKAALEAAHGGIMSFDDVFLPFLVLPNRMTVAEAMRPEIESALAKGIMPRLGIEAPSKKDAV
jgi:hypothetical protein